MLQENLIDVRHTFLFHLCYPGIETRWKERERERGREGEREREKRNHHTISLLSLWLCQFLPYFDEFV